MQALDDEVARLRADYEQAVRRADPAAMRDTRARYTDLLAWVSEVQAAHRVAIATAHLEAKQANQQNNARERQEADIAANRAYADEQIARARLDEASAPSHPERDARYAAWVTARQALESARVRNYTSTRPGGGPQADVLDAQQQVEQAVGQAMQRLR